jgi:hypothetical protein
MARWCAFDHPEQSGVNMLYFPQLSNGVTAQYPITRMVSRRTIANELANGGCLKLDDPAASGIVWRLEYSGLSDAEREAIEKLFRDVEGRLGTFTFLDPCDNLLRWSEDLSKAVWQKGGAIGIATEAADPFGSQRGGRITNTGQSWAGVRQAVDCPAGYRYCFSAWLRATGAGGARLTLNDGTGEIGTERQIGPEWRRYACSGDVTGGGDQLTCGIEIGSGAVVEVFGCQLDAQPNPSAYRMTRELSGVYRRTRFDMDAVSFVAHGVDDHAVELRLYSHTGAVA